MKTCWEMLEIAPPTIDIDLIKSARRSPLWISLSAKDAGIHAL
jgi:hypothetical protein